MRAAGPGPRGIDATVVVEIVDSHDIAGKNHIGLVGDNAQRRAVAGEGESLSAHQRGGDGKGECCSCNHG